ncbi:hypothetical protein ATCC90586_001470 [Pythium insidiosum]|nr:hypothetical protein ATCC90586_001470 [Pythium insidiosum]
MAITSDEVNYLVYRYLQECDGIKAPDSNGVEKVDNDALVLLSGHEKEVYNCLWNPVKNVLDGALVKTYQASGDIYDVNWNRDGDLIAACAASGDVAIINFRL